MLNFRAPFFLLILLVYLVAGGLYAGLTPAWQAPDEPAHYNYVRYLATALNLPELRPGCYDQAYLSELTARRFPPELSVDDICYEFHQPPLYYLLSVPVFWLSDGSVAALRLFSVVLGATVVILAYVIGRTIFPNRPVVAYGTMAFTAFVPMHVAMLAAVNNDALAELLFAAILLLLTRRIMQPVADRGAAAGEQPSPVAGRGSAPPDNRLRNDALLGILLGCGLLTKLTVYIALPLVAATLWLESSRYGSRRDWTGLIKQAGLIYGLALLIACPWYIRNAALYGGLDIWGLARHDAVVVGQLRTVDYVAEVGWSAYVAEFMTTTFRSFWGQFGWMAVPMDGRTYQLLIILTAMALGGLIGFTISLARLERNSRLARGGANRLQPGSSSSDIFFRPLSNEQRQALGLMALTVLLMALAYGWYNLSFKQFQGRYLFPAIIPGGLFFALGLREAFSQRRQWQLAGGLGVALGWVALASVLNGGLDKWTVSIVGFAWGTAVGRALLGRVWPVPAGWLVGLCLGGLALLTLLSPFWFVLPYLSF